MGFDLDTIFVFAGAMAGAHSLGLGVTWWMNRDIPGLKFWLLAYAFFAVAIALLIVWGAASPLVQSTVNLCAIAGLVCGWQGTREYQAQPDLTPLRWGTIAAVALVGNIYFGFIDPQATPRFLLTMALMGFTAFAIAYNFLIPETRKKPVNLYIGILAALLSAFLLYMGISYMIGVQSGMTVAPTDRLDVMLFAFSIFLALFSLGIIMAVTQRVNERLRQQADTDPLTHLYNRRAFELAGQQALGQCARRGSDISAIMLDIDHFKRVNDDHGHNMGDKVLCEIANLLKSSFRSQDVLARLGGEEFCVLMPETDLKTAEMIAGRIHSALDGGAVKVNGGTPITASLGVSSVNAATTTLATLDTLTEHADHALYRAKHEGRNRVETYELTLN